MGSDRRHRGRAGHRGTDLAVNGYRLTAACLPDPGAERTHLASMLPAGTASIEVEVPDPAGCAVLAWARSGLMALTGCASGPPLTPPAPVLTRIARRRVRHRRPRRQARAGVGTRCTRDADRSRRRGWLAPAGNCLRQRHLPAASCRRWLARDQPGQPGRRPQPARRARPRPRRRAVGLSCAPKPPAGRRPTWRRPHSWSASRQPSSAAMPRRRSASASSDCAPHSDRAPRHSPFPVWCSTCRRCGQARCARASSGRAGWRVLKVEDPRRPDGARFGPPSVLREPARRISQPSGSTSAPRLAGPNCARWRTRPRSSSRAAGREHCAASA